MRMYLKIMTPLPIERRATGDETNVYLYLRDKSDKKKIFRWYCWCVGICMFGGDVVYCIGPR